MLVTNAENMLSQEYLTGSEQPESLTDSYSLDSCESSLTASSSKVRSISFSVYVRFSASMTFSSFPSSSTSASTLRRRFPAKVRPEFCYIENIVELFLFTDNIAR